MIATTQTYKNLFESGAVQEYRITIGGNIYSGDDIQGHITLNKSLFDKETFTIGSFTVDTLDIKLKIPSESIARRATVQFEYRYIDGEIYSEWVRVFKGNVSNRVKETEEITKITAQTVAANYDLAINVLSVAQYPANARTVATQLATHLGLTLDNPNDIINLNIVEYPNEMTVVEMLKEIAANSGGNWIIVGDKLRLVLPRKGETTAIGIDNFIASGVVVIGAPLEAMSDGYSRNYIIGSDEELNEITWNDIDFETWEEWI